MGALLAAASPAQCVPSKTAGDLRVTSQMAHSCCGGTGQVYQGLACLSWGRIYRRAASLSTCEVPALREMRHLPVN